MKKLLLIATVALISLCALPAAAQPPRGEQPTVEQQLEQLKTALDLDDAQSAQIAQLLTDRKMPERGNREAMKEAMEAEKKSMKEILTEEQYTKWEKLMQQRGPQGGRPERQ